MLGVMVCTPLLDLGSRNLTSLQGCVAVLMSLPVALQPLILISGATWLAPSRKRTTVTIPDCPWGAPSLFPQGLDFWCWDSQRWHWFACIWNLSSLFS